MRNCFTRQDKVFQAVRYKDPHKALGLSVALTMRHAAFSELPFGVWARVLVGQVNRGHYLVLLVDGVPQGFGGWFPARKADAEAWLNSGKDIAAAPDDEADCGVVNAFVAPSAAATRFLRDAMLREAPTLGTLYWKRVKGGRRRLTRVANPRPGIKT